MPGGSAINGREIEIEIEQTRARLAVNEVERRALEAVLKDLLSRQATKSLETPHALIVADATMLTAASSSADKIALFRHLFAGRHDVFPVRWENRKTAKSGYSPACANEWVRGICSKPQVKCGECPHQAFI
ncbi:TOTE conflict system archaeo-eukaryotic primase domain-containing protein, partial [Roseiarcus sp.]|uniref:TOTE conflict system archaeo-eukaryotic primase domain-containing protein n=1 Tax=Roseiarcus sp. TaxID=1969460 RepID=UPI003C5EFE4E